MNFMLIKNGVMSAKFVSAQVYLWVINGAPIFDTSLSDRIMKTFIKGFYKSN